jgi:hypothetical protein
MHPFDQHHPVRSLRGGSAVFFLMSRPPLLSEGNSRAETGMTKLRVSRAGMRLQEFRIRNLGQLCLSWRSAEYVPSFRHAMCAPVVPT